MKRLFKYLLPIVLVLWSFSATAATGKLVIVKEEKIRNVLSEYILKRLENTDVEVKIRHIGFSGDVTVPPGNVAFEVIAPQQWEGWGKTVLALIIRVNDRVEKNLSVPVEVEALAEMVVAARPLERGETIGASDVVLRKRDMATVTGKICRNTDDVVGKRVRVGMRGNSPVRSDHLEKVPLVKSGQTVTIIAENDMMRVTAVGKARSSGAEGDLVTVRNLNSQKDIPARVMDANTVKVDF